MPGRTLWSEYEAALLLCELLKVLDNELDRKDAIIKTDEPRTLDFSGVRGFLVTNVCIVQRSTT